MPDIRKITEKIPDTNRILIPFLRSSKSRPIVTVIAPDRVIKLPIVKSILFSE